MILISMMNQNKNVNIIDSDPWKTYLDSFLQNNSWEVYVTNDENKKKQLIDSFNKNDNANFIRSTDVTNDILNANQQLLKDRENLYMKIKATLTTKLQNEINFINQNQDRPFDDTNIINIHTHAQTCINKSCSPLIFSLSVVIFII